MNCELKLATKQRIVLKNLGGEPVLKFLQRLVLDSYFVQNSRLTEIIRH